PNRRAARTRPRTGLRERRPPCDGHGRQRVSAGRLRGALHVRRLCDGPALVTRAVDDRRRGLEPTTSWLPTKRYRIATVPFTCRNLKQDLEDVGSKFDGAPDLEFRLATGALELEQSGLSYQHIPPGYRFPYGHTHTTQEEV